MTDKASVAAELLPCPFCGEHTARTVEGDGRWYVCCCNPHCFCALGEVWDRDAMPDHHFLSEEDAIFAWNDRAQPAAAEPVDEAKLEKVLNEYLSGCYMPDGKLPGMILTSEAKDMAMECMRRVTGSGGQQNSASAEARARPSTEGADISEGVSTSTLAGTSDPVIAVTDEMVERAAYTVCRRNFNSWWPSAEVIEKAHQTDPELVPDLESFISSNERELAKRVDKMRPDMRAALEAALRHLPRGVDRVGK